MVGEPTRAGASHGSARLSRALAYLPWLPVLVGIVWAAIFLVDLRSDVQGIYANSDVVSAPFIGQLYHSGDHVTLGNILWFPALFFELATRGLPAHREIWELAPYLLSLIGIGLVAATVRRVAGGWAAAMTTAALAVASPYLLVQQFGWSIHALTYAEVALLGWFLVRSAAHEGALARGMLHWLAVALLTATVAIVLAADELLAFAGVLPFVLAALLCAWQIGRGGRTLAGSALIVTVLGTLGAVLLHRVVVDNRIVPAHFPIAFSADDQILSHLGLVVQSGFDLFSGGFGGQAIHARSALSFLCAVVVLIAIAAGLAAAVGGARRLWVFADGTRRPEVADGARVAFFTFWGLVAILTCVGYVFSSVPQPGTARYVVPAAYALVAILAARSVGDLRRRAAVLVGVTLLTLGALVADIRHELRPATTAGPTAPVAARLASALRAHGLTVGYAGYWDAAPLTWGSHVAIRVFPVDSCGTTLCPFSLHTIAEWYTPRSHLRTFLVSDPTQPLNPAPPAALGRPQQVLHVAQLTIDVYGYDIASKFG